MSAPNPHRAHELSKRLGDAKVAEFVTRATEGASVRSLALELGVATSALTRLLRERGVVIRKGKVTDDEAAKLAAEYIAGATMNELQLKYDLSHGVVSRSLHKSGVRMRPSAPRRRKG